MPNQIFNSIFTLYFNDKYCEAAFLREKNSFRKKYNIILCLMLTLMSTLVSTGLIINYKKLLPIFSVYYLTIICFITGGLNIVFSLLCIFVKGDRPQQWLSYFCYMLVYFTFMSVRFYFAFILKVDLLVYSLVFVLEMMFRLFWAVLGLIDFVPGVFIVVINVSLNVALISPTIPLFLFYSFTIYTSIILLTCGLSYFFIKEQKKSFYYNLSLKLKNEWYESIIDNMNSGFISIKNNVIQYNNKTLLSFVKTTVSASTNENINLMNVDMNDLFDNIILENGKIESFDQVADILNQKYYKVGNSFTFLGTKDVEITTSCFINLEVFGRCYSSNHNVIDRYEFIFNDITRSKQIEQKNAEFKYKTLFLSKVAHEFKNPLLCISELVDQVNDNLKTDNPTKQMENKILGILKQIKSMSNYLIILVKDMDYFSQKNADNKIEKKMETDKVNLSDTIKFSNDIVQTLIKKSQKEENIKFQVIKENTLPTLITTDEIKLKQVLINLLSNAVKYTYNGLITLRISLEDVNLKFQIEDTGKGISDIQKENLFKPFANEFDKLNKISSGLGLSIVKELIEILGSKLEFDSTVSKGSTFWFSIKLNENDLDNSNLSDKTLPGTHFNEQPIQNRLSNSIASIPEAKYNIIVVDDDSVIRQSTIRLLYKVCKEKNLGMNILEANDGLECLNIYYNYIKEGKSISFILSDVTMEYLNGNNTAEVLYNISKNKGMTGVPFYILSAYESFDLGTAKDAVNDIFTKPLRKQYIEEILKNFIL
jgi:signal transduction histidine kinase/CheY-like chemotaxis protein